VSSKSDALLDELCTWGLGLPGAHRKAPWPGHDDLAVKDKIFAHLPAEGEPFSMSVKLRYTGEDVLKLPFAEPTGYGLGKSGWVTLRCSEDELPSLDQLKAWAEESYRVIAPKRLVKELDATL
jgi:predicted DNA-binding protein (MmcQ/YjbR family)